jgi:hypothetical protein
VSAPAILQSIKPGDVEVFIKTKITLAAALILSAATMPFQALLRIIPIRMTR